MNVSVIFNLGALILYGVSVVTLLIGSFRAKGRSDSVDT